MTFAFPGFFWAALALLPLVAAYFIRTRPRRQVVNAFFLWQQVFREKASSSLFQRLRNLFSLLLVALAFIAAVMALTRPHFDDGAAPDLLIIVDRSASMQAVENGKSRLDRSKEMARSWIAALGGSQRAAIVGVAGQLEYRAHFTSHPRLLNEALDAIEPSDEALNPHALDEFSLLASALEGNREGNRDRKARTRVLLITDRHSPAMQLPDTIEVVSVGGEAGNAGITAADLRWAAPGKATLFVSVVSDFPEETEFELELVSAKGETFVRLFTMKVPARGEAVESLPIEGIEPGQWILRLRSEDSLAIDNVAPLGLNAPQPVRVQVRAKNPYFFQQCILAFSQADSLFEPTDEEARLSLVEGSPPETDTAIVFAPAGDSPFWHAVGEELPEGAPEVIAKDHPLLARLDPALLRFDGARKLSAPPGSVTVLAHADGTPLLYTCSVGGKHAVILNFDPAREGFFLSPWFPVLVHDAAVLLTGRENTFPSAVATGDRVDIPGTGEVEEATFQSGERVVSLPAVSPGTIARVGNYTFSRDATTWRVGGAVFSAEESGPASGVGGPAESMPASGWPLSVWLLLAAVAVVLAEEFLYHRRKVG